MDLKNLNPKAQKIVIGGKYILKERLGGGSFGQVYSARLNPNTISNLAIKLEKRAPNTYMSLSKEAKILHDLREESGFPTFYEYGKEEELSFLVIDLLGMNLEKLFKVCNYKFSLKTVLMLAMQMIARIESLHSKSYLHRDIKPENFCMGINQTRKTLNLIDFGLSRCYMDSTGKHIPYKETKGLIGTARYASINAHLGKELSRRDDLEGIGYTLIYFLKGTLPWQNLKGQDKLTKYRLIAEKKISTPIENLCSGLPHEFITYMNYVKSLEFADIPNYGFLTKLFKNLFRQCNYDNDYHYDWFTKPSAAGIVKVDNPLSQMIPRSIPKATIVTSGLNSRNDKNFGQSAQLKSTKTQIHTVTRAKSLKRVSIKLDPLSEHSGPESEMNECEDDYKSQRINKVLRMVTKKFMDQIKQKDITSRTRNKFDCATSYHSSKAIDFTLIQNEVDDEALDAVLLENTMNNKGMGASGTLIKKKSMGLNAFGNLSSSTNIIDSPEVFGLSASKKLMKKISLSSEIIPPCRHKDNSSKEALMKRSQFRKEKSSSGSKIY